MADFLVHFSAQIKCSHGAKATPTPSQQRVTVGGQAVVLVSDLTAVAGCPFQVPIGTGTKPQPCVKIQWATPAVRIKVERKFPLIKMSSGVCQSAEQIPQGAPIIASTQVRVKAT